jgi:hypothetical protein
MKPEYRRMHENNETTGKCSGSTFRNRFPGHGVSLARDGNDGAQATGKTGRLPATRSGRSAGSHVLCGDPFRDRNSQERTNDPFCPGAVEIFREVVDEILICPEHLSNPVVNRGVGDTRRTANQIAVHTALKPSYILKKKNSMASML